VSGNDLIAAPESGDWTSGVGFLGDGKALIDDLNSDSTGAADIAVDSVMETLDILGLVLDPLGGVFSAGVGWLINHIGFLKEPIDAMLGDPDEIAAVAKTWANISAALFEATGDLSREFSSIDSWRGDAADHYRTAGGDYTGLVGAAAAAAAALSGLTTATGVLVAMTRDEVFKVVSDFVERVVLYVLAALASSWITFGASLEVAITVIEVDAEMQAASIETTTIRVEGEITVYTGKLGQIARKIEPVLHALERWKGRMEGNQFGRVMQALDERGPKATIETIKQLDGTIKELEK
jgi:hypothetical protein